MPPLSQDAALLIIDFQEDFCEPHGALAVPGGRALAPTINNLLTLPFKLKLATRDYHPSNHCSFASQHPGAEPFTSKHTIRNPEASNPENAEEQTTTLWPDHCIQNTTGSQLIPELNTSDLHLTLQKGQDPRVESYSAFGPPFRKPPVAMTGLKELLTINGIRRVFVCGLAFDYCVKDTAVDAVEAGFETWLVEDASRGVDQSEKGVERTRKGLRGVGVRLVGVGEVEGMV